MTEKENTATIKNICIKWGASLFGVADFRSFPKQDVLLSSSMLEKLPFAISAAFRLSDAILDDIDDRPTALYFHHYQRINILLDTLALAVTAAIQSLGYQAVPIPASQLVDWKNQKGHLSHKHVARAAGLGWIGRNNLLVNERFGARIRLVTILTDIPLVTDSPSEGDCGSCRACIDVCPAGAIKVSQSYFDHVGCYEQLKKFSKTQGLSHHICGICVKACRGKKDNDG